ncbi:MAG: replication-associated recombination protein A, partial [Nitrospinae bacterium]|nr:replication-associated recombination protein A [Nitrospinota bacterium]
MTSLFRDTEDVSKRMTQLADKMRPSTLKDFAGQQHLIGEGKPLRKLIERDSIGSIIFWGPPGSGKTTLARIIANTTKRRFEEISAVNAGVADLRRIINIAQRELEAKKMRTILFIDEVHRFNKAQQDAVLPFVEKGIITLIGSTTENPSFEVIPALRSRCQIFRLEYLSYEDIKTIVRRAIDDKEKGIGEYKLDIEPDALHNIIIQANGDARFALNALEAATFSSEPDSNGKRKIDATIVEEVLQKASLLYDKMGSEHYDHASAFQKSLRGSDPDASIYYLAKMIAGGEDPRFIARRLIVTASEDVGNADPMALVLSVSAANAVEKLGWPEARIPLAQAVIYVAVAPKSNSAITTIDKALHDIEKNGKSYPVPVHLKDSHYGDAFKYGFGKDYKYPHNFQGHYVEQ